MSTGKSMRLLSDDGWIGEQEDNFISINIKDQNVSNIFYQSSDLI